MTRWTQVSQLVAAVAGCEVAGAASAFAALAVGGSFRPYFDSLRRPPLTPPAALFGPVWTGLYALMAIAAWLVWQATLDQRAAVALGLFGAQLVLNSLWSIVFFGVHRPGWALLEIALLWTVVLATVAAFWRLRPLAGALLLPYLAWVSFAAYLNAGIRLLN
jgi:translocator protein